MENMSLLVERRGRSTEFCSAEIFIVKANPNDPDFGLVRQVTSYPDNYLEAALPSWDPSNSNILYYAEWQWGSYGKIHRVNIESGVDDLIPDLVGSRIEWFDVTTDGTKLLFSRNYQFYGFQDVDPGGSSLCFLCSMIAIENGSGESTEPTIGFSIISFQGVPIRRISLKSILGRLLDHRKTY